MKPKSSFIQPFKELPDQLPIYPLENALLPGGELPLELSKPEDLALFIHALKTNQLIGMVQHKKDKQQSSLYEIGCAGRIRQYRERKDGKLNIMLTGICRYKIVEELPHKKGFLTAKVNWSNYENDYQTEIVNPEQIESFKTTLKKYFDQHKMQVDWNVLNTLPIEQIVNNLVLVMNLTIEDKQQLLEADTVANRLALFASILEQLSEPILAPTNNSKLVN